MVDVTRSNNLIYKVFKFSDLLAFIVSLFILVGFNSTLIESNNIYDFLTMRVSMVNFIIVSILFGLYSFFFEQLSLYQPKYLPHTLITDAFSIIKAQLIINILVLATGNLLNISIFTGWLVILVLFPATVVLTLLFRHIVWFSIKRFHLGDSNRRHILFLGDCEYAFAYANKLKNQESHIIGHLSADALGSNHNDKVIGTFKDFDEILKYNIIDDLVIFTDTSARNPDLDSVIYRAHSQGIMLRFPMASVVSTLFKNTEMTKINLDNISFSSTDKAAPELTVQSGYHIGGAFIFKRIIDLTAAVLGLIVLSPLFLVCIILINLQSRGGAFFVQERYGYNGRIFKLIKFRTMIAGADAMQDKLRETSNELDGAAFKMKNDPRITALGRFLRKSSIDELPQLINVLKGDMSLVGPRPLPKADYDRFTDFRHLRRLSVLPGITGSWQVDGRNNLSFNEWMKLDCDYIDNWDHWLDIKILLKTIPAVLKGKGAS
ncbi:glucosyltransferase [Pseudoalteromonas tunicata D2]|uniref:Glucosyltransferase n=1 Tax=Pseudoalteromonas tunicata D2 TaxID=87626 RepID=A4C661_9GAMM|nr:glucosyltransferase [Pseudoalteromonas tunicata D2]